MYNLEDIKPVVNKIHNIAQHFENIQIMEVCGTHTNAIAKYGIKSLLPENITLVSGPGCPVCVTSQRDIDISLYLASMKNTIFCTFGDMLKVPGTNYNCLEKIKANGGDIRIVTSPLTCIKIAEENREKNVVFMAIGFETTSPANAYTVKLAKDKGLSNFTIFSLHKLITPAMKLLLTDPDIRIDGFLLPGHVCTILGKEDFEFLSDFEKVGVISGFEAMDILLAILMILMKLKNKDFKVEIEYKRAVKPEGNIKAKEILSEVFNVVDAEWRGLGLIEKSGLGLNEKFEKFDATKVYNIPEIKSEENRSCICGEILKGKLLPTNCNLFKKLCTPFNPAGPCMVSSEGTCAAYYKFYG